jgi:riboflavin kinase/FMN adenylyltransferase
MKYYKEIPDPGTFHEPVVTIGNFDGVHMGHRKILSVLMNKAFHRKGDAVVITFANHPRRIINPDVKLNILTSTEEKVKALNEAGITNVIVLDFTKEMAQLSAEEFYQMYLIDGIGTKEIVIGYDHAFGKDREGNAEFLNNLGVKNSIDVYQVEGQTIEGKPVSSTWIRKEIESGNMMEVTGLLQRRYTLRGYVVQGESRGRHLGFPTANIIPDHVDKVIPKDGVYGVRVHLESGSSYNGMLNIGHNPTFALNRRSIEVNIFDFDEDIYNQHITLEFFKYIRSEVKFNSVEDLIKQLVKDRSIITALLEDHK